MIKYQNKEEKNMKIFVVILVLILIFSPMLIFGIYRAKKNREIMNLLNEFSKLRAEEASILEEMNLLTKENKINKVEDFNLKMDRLEQRRSEINKRQEELSKMVGEKSV